MCTPLLALGAVAAATTAAGGAYSASQQNQAGKSQQAYYNYIADQNKQAADYALKIGEARDTASQNQGALESAKHARDVASFSASQKAIMAANGLASDSVTATDITGDTFDKGKLDEMMIRYNADQRSWEAKTGAAYQSWDLNNQSTMNRFAGINARRAGAANANSTLFSTAASVAQMGFNMASGGATKIF